jgi:hypothetical protein
MAMTYKAADIKIGFHPRGYRIDKTATPLNRYTRWTIENERWTDPKPVCFDSLPPEGWQKAESFDWR